MLVVLARSYRGRASLQSGALAFAPAPCTSAAWERQGSSNRSARVPKRKLARRFLSQTDRGCVKTCTREERTELCSLFSSFGGAGQSSSFLVQRIRDKRSPRIERGPHGKPLYRDATGANTMADTVAIDRPSSP